MFLDQWVKFSWTLSKVPEFQAPSTGRLQLKECGAEQAEPVWETVERAYKTDTGWGIGLRERMAEIDKKFHERVGHEKMSSIGLFDGSRIVGASILWAVESEEPQLVSGVCITSEYRSRGFGAMLLHASLHHLKLAGLQDAHVITKDRITAAKYLYPKFFSKKEPLGRKTGTTTLKR